MGVMKLYVYNITQSEKMVYLSCVRNIKEGDKYRPLPITVSVKKSDYNYKVQKFPVVIDVDFIKGKGVVIRPYEKV